MSPAGKEIRHVASLNWALPLRAKRSELLKEEGSAPPESFSNYHHYGNRSKNGGLRSISVRKVQGKLINFFRFCLHL